MECVDGGEGGPPRRIDDSSLPYCAAQRNIGQEAGRGQERGDSLGGASNVAPATATAVPSGARPVCPSTHPIPCLSHEQ